MRLWRVLVLAAALAALSLTPSRSEAKGIMLVTYGDAFKHMGEVPPDMKEAINAMTGSTPEIGYKYSYFGLFWLDLWTWGGEYCLYKEKQYWPLPPAAAAKLLQVEEKKLGKPLTYTFPPLLVILVLVVALFVWGGVHEAAQQRKAKALLKDPRYERARDRLLQPDAEDSQGLPFEARRKVARDAAAALLVSEGVEPKQAQDAVALLESCYGPKPPTEEEAKAEEAAAASEGAPPAPAASAAPHTAASSGAPGSAQP